MFFPFAGKEKLMKWLRSLAVRIVDEEQAQDMVEYALLAGFIAVAAGALLPPIANSINIIFSKMASLTSKAGSL
jgi:Flp pilus assembly pilin Flp